MKKLIALAVALSLCTAVLYLPNDYDSAILHISTNAETSISDFEFDAETGSIMKYIGEDENVVIPSEINGVTVLKIGNSAFNDCSTLYSIEIPDSVTSIGNFAFQYCSNLASITIPDNVLSIGSFAFSRCSNLTTITIPNGVTNIESCTFQNCSSLSSVTISDSVTNIGTSAFYNCSGLSSIQLPNSVVSIGGSAFRGCSKLSSINLPDSVLKLGSGAFSECSSLTSIKLPDSLTSISSDLFRECSKLTSIEIPESVTSIDDFAFYRCFNLASVTIPDSVTSIGRDVFFGTKWINNTQSENPLVILNNILIDGKKCKGDVIIPNNVTEIGASAFYECSQLTSVTIPDSVTSIGNRAFGKCSNLTEISISDSITDIGEDVFSGTKWIENKQDENPLVILNGILIDGTQCKGNVKIPDGVTNIGYNAFYNCPDLTGISISDSVTNINNYAFSNCKNLTTAVIGNNVTNIGYKSFGGCSSLTEISISDSVKNIDEYSFFECPINKIIINDGSKEITQTMIVCKSKLQEVVIPDSVTDICEKAFSNCSNLTEITISDNIKNIGDYSFSGCSKLTNLIIPDNVKTIGNYAFSGCSNLTSITLSDNVSLIGERAFPINSKLSEVTLLGSNVDMLIESGLNLSSINKFSYERPSLTYYSSENKQSKHNSAKKISFESDISLTTISNLTSYTTFSSYDKLQEVKDNNGTIYAVLGNKDKITLNSEYGEKTDIENIGYTFGAATIDSDNYLYVLWGYSISSSDIEEALLNNTNNLVVIKYDLSGKEIGRCNIPISLSEAQDPFQSGNANISVNNTTLGCMFNTRWTKSSDGLNHQGAEFCIVDTNDMKLLQLSKNVGSHSFGVSLIPTKYGFASVQRGDAFSSRGINFNDYKLQSKQLSNTFVRYFYNKVLIHASGQYGSNGDHHDGNSTYLHLGGLAKSHSTYAIAGKAERVYSSIDYYYKSDLHTGIYDVFLKVSDQTFNYNGGLAGVNRIDNETGEIADRNVIWLTECNENEKAGNVKIVTLGDGSYCILWEKIINGQFDSIRYVITDECGNILRPESIITNARLSDTSIQPIVYDTTLKWATVNRDGLTFYTVDLFSDEDNNILGDVTGDGIIDATDASFILTAYAKSSTNEDDGMTEVQRELADVNKDGVVDAVDASAVLTFYALSSTGNKQTFDEFIESIKH